MLILTRKQGEAVTIGDDIRIVVMQIRGKQVRIGVDASPETRVFREEVYLKIKDENALASSTSLQDLLSAGKELGSLSPQKDSSSVSNSPQIVPQAASNRKKK